MDSTLLVALITGLTSSVATVFAIKNDISWLKKIVEKHGERLTHLEREGKQNG